VKNFLSMLITSAVIMVVFNAISVQWYELLAGGLFVLWAASHFAKPKKANPSDIPNTFEITASIAPRNRPKY
jgi:hypothetical protein